LPEGLVEVRLAPLTPKALYLSFTESVRRPPGLRLKLINDTELNALVVDVKGDGNDPLRSSVALAAEVGGQRIITVRDIDGLIASFKERGIYTIARIVVFKDIFWRPPGRSWR